ncbi:hypothetical protein TELCIR_12121 [Teladorsagia circumcincta]|uniref:Proteasomal ATPase second OB domain-containing protein n=1 Tax=Teladorsagia circumcincta TaxID=45464 RepID=A0A2G9U7C8_TELCI|nr:hypothetical protein TELCIR_12121 [Teladorsagia circumcincta]
MSDTQKTAAKGDVGGAPEKMEVEEVNKTLPYLVSNVVELLDLEDNQEEEGANVDLDAHKTKCAVIKTSTRATYFLPVVGLVEPSELKPGDLVGVNKLNMTLA